MAAKAREILNEAERLNSLREYQILDTLPEDAFDDLTLLASQICQVPIALITFIDAERQWFKSKIGTTVEEVARDLTFCAHAIIEPGMLVVEDAQLDARFADNPMVTGEPHLRFYAGASLVSSDGHAVGTICVLDHVARRLNAEQLNALNALSRQVVAQLELRRQAGDLTRANLLLSKEMEGRKVVEEILRLREKAIDATSAGVIITDARQFENKIIYVNPAFEKMTQYGFAEISGQNCRFLQGIGTSEAATALIRDALRERRSCAVEILNYRKDGKPFWNELFISPVTDADGRLTHFVGVQQDVTERRLVQESLRESEERYRYLIEHADEMIYVTRLDGSFSFINKIATEILKYSPQEFLALGYLDMVRPDYRDAVMEFYQRQIDEKIQSTRFEFPILTREGNEVWLEQNAQLLVSEGAVAGFQAVARDITRQVYEDPLTGLSNRRLFKDRLARAIAEAETDAHMLAVVLVAPDRFKRFRDSLSQVLSDQLLRRYSESLTGCAPHGCVLARLLSEEFAFLLSGVRNESEIGLLINRIHAVSAQPLNIDGTPLQVTSSVGVGIFPQDGQDASTLLRNARIALHHAKEHGEGGHEFYQPDMSTRADYRLSLETSLRRALELKELVVYYQPQVNVISGALVGCEALVRWQHPIRGMVSPGDFIPLAEEMGIISSIDEWVLREACRQIKQWERAGCPSIRISVNLSARMFQQPDLPGLITAALQETRTDPTRIDLELTEGSVMRDPENAVKILARLREMGLHLSIDDFGTGYSSLNYLKNFPINILKIDQSFIRDMTTDANGAAIVTSIISLGHNLSLKIIAEGVETEEQLRLLRLLRCDQVQGYLISRPLPIEEFNARFCVSALAT